MPKTLLALSAFAVLFLIATEALANGNTAYDMIGGRNPIIYNLRGDEVGVLMRFTPDGMAIMNPSRTTLGMGNYKVVLSQQDLKPRAKGGWVTDLTLDQIAYLRPGEIDARNRGYSPYSAETWRAWQHWATKAGCGHMLTRPDDGHEKG